MPPDLPHPQHEPPAQAAPTSGELATLSPEERRLWDWAHEDVIQPEAFLGKIDGIMRDLMRLRLAARRALQTTGLDDCTQQCPECEAWARKCEDLEDVADRYYVAAVELCHLFEDLSLMDAPVLWKCYESARFAASVHDGTKGDLVDTRGKRAREFANSDECKARWATFYEKHRESFPEASRVSIEAAERYKESLAAKSRIEAAASPLPPAPERAGNGGAG